MQINRALSNFQHFAFLISMNQEQAHKKATRTRIFSHVINYMGFFFLQMVLLVSLFFPMKIVLLILPLKMIVFFILKVILILYLPSNFLFLSPDLIFIDDSIVISCFHNSCILIQLHNIFFFIRIQVQKLYTLINEQCIFLKFYLYTMYFLTNFKEKVLIKQK